MKTLGYLAIDLAETREETVKPKGAVKRWLGKLTGAFFDEQVESEVVPMAELFGGVCAAFAARKHDNLIRLAVDARTVYDDMERTAGDLEAALEAAEPELLASCGRLQLVAEEEDDHPEMYVVLNALVYRRHAPGTYPIWIRATAFDRRLVRGAKEKPKAWRERVSAAVEDSVGLMERCEYLEGELRTLLDKLGDQLAKRMPVHARRVEVHTDLAPTPDDYFLSLREEYWAAAEVLHTAAAGHVLPEPIEPPKAIVEFVEQQADEIAKLEKKLLPKGAPTSETSASWAQYSRRRVINPRTGRICQIRSLPSDLQHPYREMFNRGAAFEERVETVGYARRLLGRVTRGMTREVSEEMDALGDRAPRTYAFMTNRGFRKRVLMHSGKLLGQEMLDLADAVARTVVRETWETTQVPAGWIAGNKVFMTKADYETVDEGTEQMFDIAELTIGTLIPLGGFAAGGPLGGVIGLAGIKVFQAALNWHSKRSGGREYSILPSAWHERRKEQRDARAEDRKEQREDLDREAGRVLRDTRQISRSEMIAAQKRMAEDFRDFGRRLIAGEIQLDSEQMLDVSSLMDVDVRTALANEVAVTQAQEKAQEKEQAPAEEKASAKKASAKKATKKKATKKKATKKKATPKEKASTRARKKAARKRIAKKSTQKKRASRKKTAKKKTSKKKT